MSIADIVIAIGVAVNVLILTGVVWRFGHWNGRVTTLLEEHQDDIKGLVGTTNNHGERIAEIEGRLRRVAG